MKYFVFSDIHGNGEALYKGLEKAGYDPYNPEHRLISCGDNFGRCENYNIGSKEIYEYLTSDMHINKPICLRGNHEDILLKIEERNSITLTDIYNGEHKTLGAFAADNVDPNLFDKEIMASQIKYDQHEARLAIKEMKEKGLFDWIKQMPFYFETEHYVFTHGFLPMKIVKAKDPYIFAVEYEYDKDWRNADLNAWIDATWSDTQKLIDYYNGELNKTLVVGHFYSFLFNPNLNSEKLMKTSELDDMTPFISEGYFNIYKDKEKNIIFIDQCMPISSNLDILVVED